MKKRKVIEVEEKKKKIPISNFISSGSTLLNLRLTGHPDCGWKMGCFHNIVGDSFAGKTILVLTALAEAANDARADGFDEYYNEPEKGLGISVKRLFGKRANNRIIRHGKKGSKFKDDIYIEDLAKNLPKRLAGKRPIIEVVDSFDNMRCKEDEKKKAEDRNFPSKPRILTEVLRRNHDIVKETKSIVFIVSQVRDNINPTLFASKKRRAGGNALKHYCESELWLAAGTAIHATFRGVKEEIGNYVIAKLKKNRSSGRKGKVQFPLIIDYGIDDILSQVEFLTQYKEWKKSDGKIKSPWGNLSKNALIKLIEEDHLQGELKEHTTELWKEIMKATKQKRKNRYN